MPTDIQALLNQMRRDGTVARVMRNPAAQFGRARRNYKGAEILPERNVDENVFRDDSVRFRTIIALDNTRYGPVHKRGGVLVGSVLVELMDSDTGNDITAKQYDALLALLERDADMDAIARITDWQDTTLNLPLVEKNEYMRWQVLVNAQIVRHGADNFTETVLYPNPSGHRVNAAGTWSDSTYDPLPDMVAGKTLFASKGYEPGRAFASTSVVTKLLNNAKIRARTGGAIIRADGTVDAVELAANLTQLNNVFQMEGLPAIETYDLQFATPTGTQPFLPRDVYVMTAATGRNEDIDLGDTLETVEDTIGYVGIGTPAGQATPGRASFIAHYENKPPRVEGEAWQTSGPVLNEPEGIYVVKSIT